MERMLRAKTESFANLYKENECNIWLLNAASYSSEIKHAMGKIIKKVEIEAMEF